MTVYIVLGVLYESHIHPITILSTLPSAGVGALLALLLTGTDLTVIALIGIILLIGIVKKNAILMIDFALEAERREGKTPEDAIFQACLLRFRPITMTTMAALLGGLPLAIGVGHRRGAAPSARHRDRRRPDLQPDAHALHDARRLPLSRPVPAALGERSAALTGAALCRWRERRDRGRAVRFAIVAWPSSCAACAVGPDYKRPSTPVPAAYKEEQPPAGAAGADMAQWKPAEPRDDASRGKWWKIFEDPASERSRGADRHLQPEHRPGRGAVPRRPRRHPGGARGLLPDGDRERVGDAVAGVHGRPVRERLLFGAAPADDGLRAPCEPLLGV